LNTAAIVIIDRLQWNDQSTWKISLGDCPLLPDGGAEHRYAHFGS